MGSGIDQALLAQADTFVALRRDLHRHPELGFQEVRTSALVAEKLAEWGYEVTRGLGGTGVVGQLRRGTGQRRLGLRADMDALPITEATGLPHASCHHGLMHACGHDGHTAMLLAAAHHLAKHGQFSGTLNLIFQPAEEGLGGARKMMDDGLFTRFPCDAIFAMHNMPGHPPGHLLFRTGAFMASSENITITLHGVGGHGAMPHHAADPVVAGAAIVLGLQSIVARNVPPLQMAVITVGAFQAGDANNVIPQTATLKLSVRSLDRSVRELLNRRIRELVEAQAHSYGVRAEVDFRGGYPVLVNTPNETEFARQVGRELVGDAKVTEQAEPLTGSEDFAFMLEDVPGSYLLIGNGDDATGGHGACMVHNPNYDFEDRNIAVGGAYWVRLAERFLVDATA
ncbi:M20 aminoacylase family protein [Acidovorax sp. RAC01]|uniref:M20 aminoacylase family protein n=1 Tax=Acidovorax sp. RAC01 TaxID=1842533 RepID=UPI00083E7363|nr:M20 aminoacylase family protein [Acidovorax sp. RAC01]AOG24595.1 amidohydrolase family protein [Acidovorax sp. RAC01]